ncbi:MAG: hypothetical protein JNM36_14310 [Chitinophagales bacterium]|nr:hypothetical protein [Chitinophagales bacterium]
MQLSQSIVKCLVLCLLLPAIVAVAQNTHELKKPLKQQSVAAFLKRYNFLPDTIYDPYYVYETRTESFFKGDGTRAEIGSGVFRTETKQISIKQAYEGYRQPIYKTIEQKVLIKPAYKKIISPPYVIDTLKIKHETIPAYTIWIKRKDYTAKISAICYDTIQKIDTCFWKKSILPPVYEIWKQTYVKYIPELQVEETIPAQYQSFKVLIIDSIATGRNPLQKERIVVPALYESYEQEVLMSPATTREIEEPGNYYPVICTYRYQENKTALIPDNMTPYIPYYTAYAPFYAYNPDTMSIVTCEDISPLQLAYLKRNKIWLKDTNCYSLTYLIFYERTYRRPFLLSTENWNNFVKYHNIGTQTPQPEQIAQLPTMQDIALYGKQLRYLQTKNWINRKSYRQLSKLLKARKKYLLNAN